MFSKMRSPEWAVTFSLLFLVMLSISFVPAVFGMPEGIGRHLPGDDCTGPNMELSDNSCFLNCLDLERGQCDPRKNDGPSCQCKPGFVLDQPRFFSGLRWNKEARCIKVEHCYNRDVPQRSADCEDPNVGYKYISCHRHECNPSCKGPDDSSSERNVCSIESCKRTAELYCVCRAGYVSETANGTGKCVREDECPPQVEEEEEKACGPNEVHYRSCFGKNNCSSGCMCMPGHVLTKLGGPCEKEESPPGLPEETGNEMCGPNEELRSECHELSCSNKDFLRNPHDPFISRRCPAKCHCREGFMRRDEDGGPCVRTEECPECGPNEWLQPNRSFPELTCATMYTDHGIANICNGPRTVCLCASGHVRREEGGPCVREDKCPQKECGPNEVFESYCGERDCNEKDDWVNGAGPECVAPPKCRCQEGFLRRERDGGPCVREADCPSLCPSGELYVESCEDKTCEDKDQTPPPNNPWDMGPGLQCGRRCACKPGQVRREEGGPCVKEEECPPKCGPNEEWQQKCASHRTCLNKAGLSVGVPWCYGPKIVCACKPDFVRLMHENDGPCVREEQCAEELEKKCGPNEELQEQCDSYRTCLNKDTESLRGPYCHGPKTVCNCKPGYVRVMDGLDGPCVKEEQCAEELEKACPWPYEERLLLCPGYKEPSCDGPKKEQLADCASLQSRCVCKQGLMRERANGQGPCVTSCPKEGDLEGK